MFCACVLHRDALVLASLKACLRVEQDSQILPLCKLYLCFVFMFRFEFMFCFDMMVLTCLNYEKLLLFI